MWVGGIVTPGLIPVENWDYSLLDAVRGLRAALGSAGAGRTLELPGLGPCIPTRSARAGIVAAIQVLGLPPGSRIGVPLYCCPVIFKSIKAAGCTPRFIDVEPDTFCMSAEDLSAKRSEVDAVIAAHMFGHVCDMPKLRDAAQRKPIIEDCAQSLGSRLDGRATGSFGAIAAFSFRLGKYLSVGEGGALYAEDEDLRCRIAERVAAMPVPTRMEDCMHVAKTYLRSKLRSRPLYGLVGYWLWSVYNKRVDFSAKTPLSLSQTYGSDLATTKRRLTLLDAAIQRQRAHAEFYSRNLNLDGCMLPLERPETFSNRFMYPIIFPTVEQRDSVAAYLRSRQIDTAAPYRDVPEGAAKNYGYNGDCPVSEETAKRILVIPSHCRLGEYEVQRVAELVNEGWARVK